MFWADKLLENISGKQVINDSWTPSGIVHMGSLKGSVIHDTLYRILKEKSMDVKFMYGFDDFDPIDGLPQDLEDSHNKYLGVPISVAPAPDGNGSFGGYFGGKMKKLLDQLGIEAEMYKTSELYKNGKFDAAIKFVLDHAQEIRDVYGSIYKKDIAPDWFPLQVICPNCGKLGTTKVTSWDGEKVGFSCEPSLVKWAQGCGTKGKISPFDGVGKMPYKVEWPAKWWTFEVTIEGAGKDHMSAGGTHDVAAKIYQDVFKKEPPLGFSYEHFLSHGKKMSSSKGIGITAEGLLEVIPPQIYRFLLIKTPPNQAVEFTPFGTDLIPKLFDEYQEYADHYFSDKKDDYARVFELSQVDKIKKPPKVRFSHLAQWAQMPDMRDKIEKEKLEEWVPYVRTWLDKYAPESEKFVVQKELPEKTKSLSDEQKKYLLRISDLISQNLTAQDLQTKIYELAKEMGLSSKDAFAAIYIALLGRDHGPRAAWLITSLDREFVKKRFSSL